MKIYEVYQHPVKGYAAVKIGFSWPGFFFGIIWALIKKLWKLAGLLFLAELISPYFFGYLTEFSKNIVSYPISSLLVIFSLSCKILFPFFIWILTGFKGNEWFVADLKNRGFRLLSTVGSTSPDAAIAIVADDKN